MKILLELFGGFVIGSLFALVFMDFLLSDDPLHVSQSKRAEKSQCESYQKMLSEPHSPEEHASIRKVYTLLCERQKP
ncbi:MAG: hypothetical protein QW212_00145 [Nitrososphaerales archaeon]